MQERHLSGYAGKENHAGKTPLGLCWEEGEPCRTDTSRAMLGGVPTYPPWYPPYPPWYMYILASLGTPTYPARPS